jgi:hypothetical protein
LLHVDTRKAKLYPNLHISTIHMYHLTRQKVTSLFRPYNYTSLYSFSSYTDQLFLFVIRRINAFIDHSIVRLWICSHNRSRDGSMYTRRNEFPGQTIRQARLMTEVIYSKHAIHYYIAFGLVISHFTKRERDWSIASTSQRRSASKKRVAYLLSFSLCRLKSYENDHHMLGSSWYSRVIGPFFPERPDLSAT